MFVLIYLSVLQPFLAEYLMEKEQEIKHPALFLIPIKVYELFKIINTIQNYRLKLIFLELNECINLIIKCSYSYKSSRFISNLLFNSFCNS